jgi:hypothetical protein
VARALLKSATSQPVTVTHETEAQRLIRCMECMKPGAKDAGYWEANGPQGQPGKWHGPGPEPQRFDDPTAGDPEFCKRPFTPAAGEAE